MTTNHKTMSCEVFQSQLSDLVGSGADIENHPHIKECDICRQLYQELQTIADAARQLFPDQQPEDKLWERIESAIKEEDGISGTTNQHD
jgi:predicted anti-sigma-YlaC factor YlaD